MGPWGGHGERASGPEKQWGNRAHLMLGVVAENLGPYLTDHTQTEHFFLQDPCHMIS